MVASNYASNVFINCPFDDTYQPIFWPITFCILDSGFAPRCAMEIDDGALVRIDKIFRIIEECKFGIHDLSRTELDPNSNLPRFNMPLELGIFLGVRRAGAKLHKSKIALIMDTEQYRYQSFISDISGQDVKAHANEPKSAVSLVRNWLNDASGRRTIPGGRIIWQRYNEFSESLPNICVDAGVGADEMTFGDFVNFAADWLEEYG